MSEPAEMVAGYERWRVLLWKAAANEHSKDGPRSECIVCNALLEAEKLIAAAPPARRERMDESHSPPSVTPRPDGTDTD